MMRKRTFIKVVGVLLCLTLVAGCIETALLSLGAMGAIGRNPEATGQIQSNMILGIAFTEAIAIYALVIALIVKFV